MKIKCPLCKCEEFQSERGNLYFDISSSFTGLNTKHYKVNIKICNECKNIIIIGEQ